MEDKGRYQRSLSKELEFKTILKKNIFQQTWVNSEATLCFNITFYIFLQMIKDIFCEILQYNVISCYHNF